MPGTLTLTRLLWCFLKGARGPRKNVRETILARSANQFPLILYSNGSSVRGTLVLVHGVTARASEDPNLVHLARCIASLGYRCLTPPLVHLANFEHSANDVDTVLSAIQMARDIAGDSVGVLAFSYGASYALSALARPSASNCCRAILAFGAYYLLADALEHQRKLLVQNPDPESDDTDLLYLRYTLLACQRPELQLSDAAWTAIRLTLNNYMSPSSLEAKKLALLEHAKSFDFVDLMERYQRRTLSGELSPAGHLHKVTCPVALLHDPNDRFVPADHLERIRHDLDARNGCTPTATLTTPMLSHVRVDPKRNLLDAGRFIGLLKPAFGFG
jgi:pimeloyl-ACP methyl ester carboxylesterase